LYEKGYIHLQRSLEPKVHQLKRAVLITSAAKLSSKRPYCANDEIIDRLSFLAEELQLEGSLVASLAERRITGRDFTRYLNPGSLENDGDGDTDGPWEVHALCHHSRLVVLRLESYNMEDWRTVEQRAEEVSLYKEKICQFFNSEATLVACWERSHRKARTGLMHSEASSVFGSTLLDIHVKGLEDEKIGNWGGEDTTKNSSSDAEMSSQNKSTGNIGYQTSHENSAENLRLEQQMNYGQKRVVQELGSMSTLMAQQLKTLQQHLPEAGQAPPIEWAETWRPPRQYHPDKFLESLDDTPDLYRPAHIKTVSVPPSLEDRLALPADGNGFTKHSLKNLSDLVFVGLADITDTEEDGIPNRTAVTFIPYYSAEKQKRVPKQSEKTSTDWVKRIGAAVRQSFTKLKGPTHTTPLVRTKPP
jgi:hypothetical protein